MSSVEAIAPVLDPLIRIQGSSPDDMATNIVFQNLSFAHTTWTGFDSAGFSGIMADIGVFTSADDVRKWDRIPSGVIVENASRIRFEKCGFRCMGGGGIDLRIACHDCAVTGCSFRDIGANAINVAPIGPTGIGRDTIKDTFWPEDEKLLCKNIEISHNRISASAFEYKGGVGIFCGYPTKLNLHHNTVWDLPYSGFFIGWGNKRDTCNAIRENRITGNYMADCTQELIDGSMIYTCTSQPGTIIDSNVLVYIDRARGPFFFFGAGSSYFAVRHNVTKGIAFTLDVSFTRGIGYDICNIDMDSNWAEWPQTYSANTVIIDECTNEDWPSNMFFDTPPQAILDNAGAHDEDVILTPVSTVPYTAKNGPGHGNNKNQPVCIYDLRGRHILTLDIKNVASVKSILQNRKTLPAGTYVIKGSGIEKCNAKKILLNY
jgi:hypothetical protein